MGHTRSTLSADELLTHRAWLRRLALALVGESSADDLVQSTLVAALRRPPELDRDVRPWFARVLRNSARQRVLGNARRRAREVAFSVSLTDALPSAEEVLIRHEAGCVVAGIVSELSEPQRSTVLLHFGEGIPLKDIALRQGLPAGTVRWRLKEALDELRTRLDRHYRGEQREWRAVLLPLASAARQTVAPLTPAAPLGAALKGVMLMNAKTKLAIAVGLAVLALWGTQSLWTIQTSAPVATRLVPSSAVAAAAVTGSGSRPGGAPALADQGAHRPPPRFATAAQAAALDTLESCQRELEKLLGQIDEEGPYLPTESSAFDNLPPSPKNQRVLAPHVERILGAFQPKPEHTLDCRLERCRLTLLAPAGVDMTPWMRAIRKDADLSRLLSAGDVLSRATRTPSPRKVNEALSGVETQERQILFTVPARREGDHPFEVADEAPQTGGGTTAVASVGACREQVQTLRKELEGRRQKTEEFNAAIGGRDGFSDKKFFAAAPNPDLTRRFQGAVDALVKAGAVPTGGTVQCHGERDCRWSFPGNAKDLSETAEALSRALREQGYLSQTTIINPRWAKQPDGRPYSAETTVMAMRLAKTDVSSTSADP
jgi:RNA polymerase sigma-70 factor (ECF subfamily)